MDLLNKIHTSSWNFLIIMPISQIIF